MTRQRLSILKTDWFRWPLRSSLGKTTYTLSGGCAITPGSNSCRLPRSAPRIPWRPITRSSCAFLGSVSWCFLPPRGSGSTIFFPKIRMRRRGRLKAICIIVVRVTTNALINSSMIQKKVCRNFISANKQCIIVNSQSIKISRSWPACEPFSACTTRLSQRIFQHTILGT